MTKQDWEYIVANWASSDEYTMEEIARIKDRDELARKELEDKLKERDDKIRDLTQQNIDLNKTNMSLFLRLTDPAIERVEVKEEEDVKIPEITDYAAFVKIE